MKVTSFLLLLSTVMTVAHVVVALPSVHWFGDGDSCPQNVDITTYTNMFGGMLNLFLSGTGSTLDYDDLDADLADMNIQDHFKLLLRKYWLAPGRPVPGATLFLQSIFNGAETVVPSNYAYLRYLLHKRPGNQQDVDDYFRKIDFYDSFQFYLKGPGNQEDAVNFLQKFLPDKFNRLTKLYTEDGRRDGIPHDKTDKTGFDRVRTLLKNTGDQTTVENILRATLASSTIDHFESNIALVGRKIADTIKAIHNDVDWVVNKDRVDNYIQNNDKDGLSEAIRGSVNSDVRARVNDNMDRIIEWRGYRSEYRGAIGKEAYIRFDFFLNGASDRTTLEDLLRLELSPGAYQDLEVLRDHTGDALVVRDVFKTFDQATRDQLDSLLDPSGIPAAIDALCKEALDPEDYEWIQEQIKETGDGRVLHEFLMDNETAYQQYLSLVNGNQEPVEKFLREKLASETFDKLQSTLKETTDKVRYMVVEAKNIRNRTNMFLRIDNDCYKFLRAQMRKELYGGKLPQQRLRLVIQH
ncbi:MAG: hypothetical protein J3Q66DRAFT_359130 [Benniella sp.]|nr:MAG: hypothetical protein J3Q66DRAFT_359130 [Benniella sp.]